MDYTEKGWLVKNGNNYYADGIKVAPWLKDIAADMVSEGSVRVKFTIQKTPLGRWATNITLDMSEA